MRALILGAGRSRDFKMRLPDAPEVTEVVTLDANADHGPDVVHDLDIRPLPFADAEFDEIHAYEVLEHVGRQGDWRAFFEEWGEYHRILKPGGMFYGSVPHWRDVWAWADPSHTRVLPIETFVFLDQDQYAEQVGVTAMSDFRRVWSGSFRLVHQELARGTQWFALRRGGE